jgi:hypothetical protein
MILEPSPTNVFVEELKDIKELIESLDNSTIDKRVLGNINDRLRYIKTFEIFTFLKSISWSKKDFLKIAKVRHPITRSTIDVFLVGVTDKSDAVYYYFGTTNVMYLYIVINDE